MLPGRMTKKAKKRKEKRKQERKEMQTFDMSHICQDHPRCATPAPPPTKVVMWDGIPDVVNHAKFHQNRFRVFGSLTGRNLPFSYATAQPVI